MLDHGYLTEHVEEANFVEISPALPQIAIDLFFMTGDTF